VQNSAALYGSCASAAHFEQLTEEKVECKWKNYHNLFTKIPSLPSFTNYLCKEETAIGLQILPPIKNYTSVMVYHTCLVNAYLATTRQFKASQSFDQAMMVKFHGFCDKVFTDEIEPILAEMKISYTNWYNHLTASQQREIREIDTSKLKVGTPFHHFIFCKKEKQIVEPGSIPKNRCICGPCGEYKYIMGPVVYKLEQVFKRNFKGYMSGCSWQDIELFTTKAIGRGFSYSVISDVSQFDASARKDNRYLEEKIYKYVAQNLIIPHVDSDLFLYTSTMDNMFLQVYDYRDGTKNFYARVSAKRIRCSGDPQTSFGNTILNVMYNRFVWEVILGAEPDDYLLKVSGDDGEVMHYGIYTEAVIDHAYSQVYVKKRQTQAHGLGLIAKYIKHVPSFQSDFCSTMSFWCNRCGFKMTRDLKRFFQLMPYSLKMSSMSRKTQMAYEKALWEANSKWIGNLPLFKQYNDLLYHNDVYPLKNQGLAKEVLPHDGLDVEYKVLEEPYLALLRQIDSDLFWSTKDRISIKCDDCCKAFVDMIVEKTAIIRADIEDVCMKIDGYSQDRYNDDMQIMDLVQLLESL